MGVLGSHHSRSRRPTISIVSSSLLVAVLLGLPGAPVAAVDEETHAFWKNLFGKQLKLKGDPIVYVDGSGDGINVSTGQPAALAGYGDVKDFALLVTKLRKPQVNALAKRQRARKIMPILGAKANPKAGQTWVFVGANMAEPLASSVPGGVQLNAAFDGAGATPLYGGAANDLVAGSSTLFISGQFDGYDSLLAGATDTSGTQRHAAPEYNNLPARTSGFVDGSTWVVGMPLPKGAEHVQLAVTQYDGQTQLMDLLTTPGGVSDILLMGPALPDDFCFAGNVFPIHDANGDVVTYHVELAIGTDAPLAPDDLSAITVVPTGPGSSTGSWRVFPELHSAFGDFDVPPGEATLRTDSWATGEIDAIGAGPAAFLDGMPLDLSGTDAGSAFGSPQCGHFDRLDGGIPEQLGEDWAAGFGFEPGDIVQFGLNGLDGSDVRIVVDATSGQPLVVLVAGTRPETADDFERRMATSFCDLQSVDVGDVGTLATCPDGVQRLFWFEAIDGQDGLLDFGRTFTVEAHPPASVALPDGTRLDGFGPQVSSDWGDLISDLEKIYASADSRIGAASETP